VVLRYDPSDPHAVELLSGYRDFPYLKKPIAFGELYGWLVELLGAPLGGPSRPPSIGQRRHRSRRTSGHRGE
jgi:hypothetical protein